MQERGNEDGFSLPGSCGETRRFSLRSYSRAIILKRMSDVTSILNAIESGDANAAARLLPLVYDELRKLAALKLKNEKPGQTLDATALFHEAYLRLVGDGARPTLKQSRKSTTRF